MTACKGTTRTDRRIKFSAAFITKLVRGELSGEFADTESPLRVRSTTTGAQFLIMRKVDGRVVRITARDVNNVPVHDAAKLWTLSQARLWAKNTVADITRGQVPTRPKTSDTFAGFAAALMTSYREKRRPNSVKARQLGLRDLDGIIGRKALSAITSADAVLVREALSGSPARATRAWASARWVMRAAVERGIITANPFAKDSVTPPVRPASRKRYPSLEDLVAIDKAAAAMGTTGGDVIRFAMRLPLRSGAITTLTWGEIDFDAGLIHLKAAPGRKIKEDVEVPLPPMAAAILRARRPKHPHPDAPVFPNSKGAPFSAWSSLYRDLHRASGTSGWSIHDMRRAVPTLTAQSPLAPEVTAFDLDRLLLHSISTTMSGVAAVYQRGQFLEAMRRAATGWERVLSAALSQNLVALRRAG
jgi:integrase